MNILTQIPAGARRIVYLAYTIVTVVVGAVQAGFATTEGGQPEWMLVVINVLVYLGAVLGLTAASNVNLQEKPAAGSSGRSRN